MIKHESDGKCAECEKIINKFPNFDEDLLLWFQTAQTNYLNFHVSEAGRGRDDQENAFHRGASKAHYGESAHNYNCALDVFFMVNGKYSLDEALFRRVMTELPLYLEWYGEPGAAFYERPHVEKVGWRDMAKNGLVELVE